MRNGPDAGNRLMRKILDIPVEKIVPSMMDVLKGQDIPESAAIPPRTAKLAQEALSVFKELARPAALLMEVAPDEFRPVLIGEGQNAGRMPLDDILRRADSLALFAVTVGDEICEEIVRQFEIAEFAPGTMLDAAASAGTENLADELEENFRDYLCERERFDSSTGLMPFSPGYCGWHITAQRKLFETLRPEEIGIYLNNSCLMQPLKSISGVMVAGPKDVFEFEDDFDFCGECRTRSCRARIAALRKM